MCYVPPRYGPLDRALVQVRRIEASIIDDLVHARIAAGLSRSALGAAVGLSADEIGRIERRELRSVVFEDVARYACGVGLALAARLHPDGDPVRDAPQQKLLGRLRDRVGPGPRWREEVPLDGITGGDRRAWDAVLDGHRCLDAIEAETRFHDGQATIRRIQLKLRDDRSVRHVFLLVADTRANREAIRAVRPGLRADFPLDGRPILSALAHGRCPGQSGIVIL